MSLHLVSLSEVGNPHPHTLKFLTPDPDRTAGWGHGTGCPHETELFCSLGAVNWPPAQDKPIWPETPPPSR